MFYAIVYIALYYIATAVSYYYHTSVLFISSYAL